MKRVGRGLPLPQAVASVLAALATQQAMPLLPGQQWCGADGGLAVCVCQFLPRAPGRPPRHLSGGFPMDGRHGVRQLQKNKK